MGMTQTVELYASRFNRNGQRRQICINIPAVSWWTWPTSRWWCTTSFGRPLFTMAMTFRWLPFFLWLLLLRLVLTIFLLLCVWVRHLNRFGLWHRNVQQLTSLVVFLNASFHPIQFLSSSIQRYQPATRRLNSTSIRFCTLFRRKNVVRHLSCSPHYQRMVDLPAIKKTWAHITDTVKQEIAMAFWLLLILYWLFPEHRVCMHVCRNPYIFLISSLIMHRLKQLFGRLL